MADGCVVCMLCYLCFCTVLLCTVLQGVGLFTPLWIVDETCDTRGLFYRCCAVSGTDGCTPIIERMFSLIGCILIGVENPTTSLGASFYLCLVAGCYALVQVIIVCSISCYHCCKSDDKSDAYRTDVGLENPAGPGQTGPGGGTTATTQDTDTGFPINFKAAQFVIPKMLQTVRDRFSMDS